MTWYFYNNRGVLQQDGLPDAVPVGLTLPFISDELVSATPPNGWLLCNGSSGHLTATYPRLAALLAYPAAPGATFTVPNMSTRIPVGVSGAFPLNTAGGTANHPHTVTGHSHANSHVHTVGNHVHGTDHTHAWGSSPHTHGVVNYNLGSATTTRTADDDVTDTPTSLGSHSHSVSGATGDPRTYSASLSPRDLLHPSAVTDSSGLNTTSGGADTTASQPMPLPLVAPALVAGGDVLPPYLNVYFIIKAEDFSGTYT